MQKKVRDLLPSKQFVKSLGVLVGIIIIIGGIGFLVNRKSIFSQNKNNEASPIVVKDIIDSDSDNDGLADWQETLWGLDPNNRDTDADGIADKDELDIIQKQLQTPTDLGSLETTTDAETKTDKFAEQVVQIVSALQASGQLTDQNQEALVDQITVYAEDKQESTTYTDKDIKKAKDSYVSFQKYLKEIDAILKRDPIIGSDFELLLQFDPDQFELLQTRYSSLSKKYDNMIASMKNILVPEAIAFEHVNFMNALWEIKDTFDKFALLETDPILTLQRYVQIEDTLSVFSQAAKGFSTRINFLYNSK